MTPNAQMGLWWALSLWLILHSGDSCEVYACEPLTLIGVESSACIAPKAAFVWILLFREILGDDRLIGELSSKGVLKLGLQGTARLRNSKDPSKRATTIWGLKERQKGKVIGWFTRLFVRSIALSFVCSFNCLSVCSFVRLLAPKLVRLFVVFLRLSNHFFLEINDRIR